MIVAVTGGRKLPSWYRQFCFDELDKFKRKVGIGLMRSGRAKGWDQFCEEWATAHNIEIDPYAVDWEDLSHPQARIIIRADGSKYDAGAGLRRNIRMLDSKGSPDWLIAGPGGTGTAHMINQAKIRGIPVWECRING